MATESRKFTFFIIAHWHDPRFKRKVGGLIRIFELADNLTRLGNNVVLFLPKIGFPKKQTIAKVIEIPFIDFPLLRLLSFQLISTLILFVKLIERPDFLYIRQMNSFFPMLIAKLFRIPAFFEIPNDPYLAYQSSGKIKHFLERIIDRYSMILADKIIVLSEWSKRRLNKLGRIPNSKITVLPSGTDTELFQPLEKKECCDKLHFDPSFYYVGFIGSFFLHQGIDTLINAAPIILSEIENTRFLLVGDGPMMDIWKNKVKKKGIQDAFIFTSQVPYKKVPEYIGVMDICVAPHQKDSNQASPVKIFDYMACGRPIVASDIDVVREIVGESECALLVAPQEVDNLVKGIISLIEDEERRKEMSIRGREYAVYNFNRKKITEDLLSNIQKLKAK
ncbi:MAG: glycosyltransferase family 4 protein [bacterium]